MKLIYSNVGCMRGGKPFPTDACKELIKNYDVFILVEASEKSVGFYVFNANILNEGFVLYKNTWIPENNQVMIGVKRTINVLDMSELGEVAPQEFRGRGVGINTVDSKEVVPPNYLRVIIQYNGTPIDIIGARIPSYGKFKKDNNPTPKCYNAELCSFRQMLEALDRDLKDEHRMVIVMDGNNALHYGDFYMPYNRSNYKGKAQINYNFHILKDELGNRDLALKEGINDSSWGCIHDDHAFFKNINIEAVKVGFFKQKEFDHKIIEVLI